MSLPSALRSFIALAALRERFSVCAMLVLAAFLAFLAARQIASEPLHVGMLTVLIALPMGLGVVLLAMIGRLRRDRAEADKQYAAITHAARLALAGEITASIAHEVAQPLSAILNNVETAELLLRRGNPDLGPIREILADIRNDDLRAHSIISGLSTLLRKRVVHYESVEVNSLVAGVLSLVHSDAIRRNIVLNTTLEPGLPEVAGDPVHLQQVLLNLIINAMDAMRETPHGERRVDIRTERIRNSCIQIAICDRGHGIAPEHTEKVFDSFFTTKHDGMGLGLSIARSIVQKHGGRIWAENLAVGGTAFRFTVPLEPTQNARTTHCAPGRIQ